MMLPRELQAAIQAQIEHVSMRELTRAAEILRERYCAGERNTVGPLVQSSEQALAYAAYRMPSTYAALYSALDETARRLPEWQPRTLVEAGCGPGPSVWAATELWPSLEESMLLDSDTRMLAMAQAFVKAARRPSISDAAVRHFDLIANKLLPQADLVIAAYVLGEMPGQFRPALVDRLWQATRGVLVLIEGAKSSRGFDVILAARQRLIELGARIAAPCPNENKCPKSEGDSWCHFARRVERSQAQRILKEGFRPYEDEKFSYIAASRVSSLPIAGRVTLQPHVIGNASRIEVCAALALEEWRISKNEKPKFRRAKKLYWGEAIETDDPLVSDQSEDESEA